MLREGTVLDGKYEILKQIGEGGMSIVYLARNNRMNMQLAVKEIKNDGSKSTEILLKGLEREANILKDVDHPVIPRIIDIVKHGGTICVVMDFIEGENLSDKLKEVGAFSQDEVIEWGLELASALEYLHSMNPPIIYRDMKPSNVMLKPDGGVKLIDFGTAKTYEIENNADTTALGTRGYAAPEQFGDAQGRGIYKTDARTDIYNLGATLYHMVTGKNPQEPPYEMIPIRQANPALSTGLEEIILKCTKPNPEDRYQSCSELIYALEHYTELDDSYKNANKKKVMMFAVSAALTLVFAGVAVAGKIGANREAKNNYYAYINEGDDLRAAGDYSGAAGKYREAFETKSGDGTAYVKFIDVYIDANHDVNNKQTLELDKGLNTVANRINSGEGKVNEDNEVLYKMGITYFSEIKDYGVAAKYFNMVDENDEDYGELAGYYGSIALIMSSADINKRQLIDNVNGFASYNSTNFTNDNTRKFENYLTVGKIYASNLNVEGVPEQAENVMSDALTDLEEYQGEDSVDFYYEYSKILAEIYTSLAEKDESESYYKLALNQYNNIILTVQGKVKVDSDANNESVKGYVQDYVNSICKMAEIYSALGDTDNAISTYEDGLSSLGAKNESTIRIYSEYLNFLYTSFEAKQQDPGRWSASQKKQILDVYHKGQKVVGIDKNQNWIKRTSTMEDLEKASSDQEDDKGEGDDN